MAIAIKTLTAKRAYQDLTDTFSDRGRLGKTVKCGTCGQEYVLYYGQDLEEQEATAWLERSLPAVCPGHNGWLLLNEAATVSADDHRKRVQLAIAALQRRMGSEVAAAKSSSGSDRDRLILSYSQKGAEINELQREL